jgi:ribonuclease BN (tRNA processing enzyme)
LIDAKVLYSKSAVATQILLTSEGASLLVDAGDGLLRDLTEAKFDFDGLKAVLITHEHFDHTGGLFSLLHFMRHFPRREDLLICVPKPVVYVQKLLEPPLMYSEMPFAVKIKETYEGDHFDMGPFHVEPFRTNHADAQTLGFSVSDRIGFRVVISGDTSASQNLRSRVEGADLAVLESTFEDGQEAFAERYGHMTASQSRELGRLAKKAVYVHQMPQDYFVRMTCSEVSNS